MHFVHKKRNKHKLKGIKEVLNENPNSMYSTVFLAIFFVVIQLMYNAILINDRFKLVSLVLHKTKVLGLDRQIPSPSRTGNTSKMQVPRTTKKPSQIQQERATQTDVGLFLTNPIAQGIGVGLINVRYN